MDDALLGKSPAGEPCNSFPMLQRIRSVQRDERDPGGKMADSYP